MTDNPYAAPQTAYVREESLHTRSIRTVATIYRILGGFLIANFGLGSLFALSEMSNQWIQDPLPGVAPAPILFPLLGSAGCFVLFIGSAALGWEYVRLGSGMLNRHPLDYGRVRFFAYLMLLAFPLVLLGAYCNVQLRRHWQAYCEESAETN
jgi:hypothetical protein